MRKDNENKENNSKDKAIDLIVYETREKILEVLNNSRLPISVTTLIINELNQMAYKQYDITINNLTK